MLYRAVLERVLFDYRHGIANFHVLNVDTSTERLPADYLAAERYVYALQLIAVLEQSMRNLVYAVGQFHLP